MEKTTKKKKSKRRAQRRRIGLIAVGGLSLVLTVCLSVGATLAWFAGSTWASNDLYMGGPVYVEMAGRGTAGLTEGTGAVGDGATANWSGGDGKLDIIASKRTTGTTGLTDYSNILLPGQKLLIYSQARVFSTLLHDTTNAGNYPNQSSGANTYNTSDGTATYRDSSGRVRTATTSVLRAKFSINVEFDPSVGFNNFTDKAYANAYPVQSSNYTGDGESTEVAWYQALTDTEFTQTKTVARTAYNKATNQPITLTTQTIVETATDSGVWVISTDTNKDGTITSTEDPNIAPKAGENDTTVEYEVRETGYTNAYTGRRDAVKITGNNWATGTITAGETDAVHKNVLTVDEGDLKAIKSGEKVSIFKWKFVSENVYAKTPSGLRMGKPFDGTVNTFGTASNRTYTTNTDGTLSYSENRTAGATGNGFYGVWEGTDGRTGAGTESSPYKYSYTYEESDAFFTARRDAYLQSYVEHYKDPYNQDLVLQIGSQIHDLENALNESFKGLVTQSSDRILAGYINGFTADNQGYVKYNNVDAASLYKGGLGTDKDDFNETAAAAVTANTSTRATWLYVDPKIDNDINATDATTGTGGWWYLVESDTNSVASGKNAITTVVDTVANTASADDDVTKVADQDDVDEKKATYVGQIIYDWTKMTSASKNVVDGSTGVVGTRTEKAFVRSDTPTANVAGSEGVPAQYGSQNRKILQAKLFEVKPNLTNPDDDFVGAGATKVVSVSFPFVNGNFELPGKELTNIFANAKITFKISFQALQAFFPFTPSIDGLAAGSALAGTAKALSIENSIPIFNEAFNYLSYISQ